MVVPPPDPNRTAITGATSVKGFLDVASEKNRGYQPVRNFATMATAYSKATLPNSTKRSSNTRAGCSKNSRLKLKRVAKSFIFNDTKPFLHATIIYIFAFVLAGFSLLTFSALRRLSESLRKSSFYLVMLAGVVHTFGLIFRMYLEGRPPVTNLYSSAIFIGWGAMILGLVLERIYRVGIGVAVASLPVSSHC